MNKIIDNVQWALTQNSGIIVGIHPDYELILKAERANLEENARVCNDLQYGNVWYWQGDGYDFPESLVCPVVMSADTLRDLLSKIPSIDSQ